MRRSGARHTAIVTGANHGIGAATALALAAAGGLALAVEADLSDTAAPAALFDAAEQHLGPVDILVNNATGWVQDTFAPKGSDRLGRSLQPVTAATWQRQFTVDAMAPALLISEFARRQSPAAGHGAASSG